MDHQPWHTASSSIEDQLGAISSREGIESCYWQAPDERCRDNWLTELSKSDPEKASSLVEESAGASASELELRQREHRRHQW